MFRNMEYVYEVYKEKSFTKAAKNLYVTQPCLSALVKKTEQKLGFPIFNRNASPLQLTECGAEYIRYIEKIMTLENEFDNYLNDVRGLKTGHLSIGSNNAFSALVDKALADGEELLVILAHGGTQMAAMERYALPRRDYYAWCGPNAGGYVLDAADWAEKRQLRLVKTVQYAKDAEAGV